MLIRVPFHSTDVGLAKIVMPRSRSRVGAGLFKQFVHEGCFAVVNVGDDGDIAEFH